MDVLLICTYHFPGMVLSAWSEDIFMHAVKLPDSAENFLRATAIESDTGELTHLSWSRSLNLLSSLRRFLLPAKTSRSLGALGAACFSSSSSFSCNEQFHT